MTEKPKALPGFGARADMGAPNIAVLYRVGSEAAGVHHVDKRCAVRERNEPDGDGRRVRFRPRVTPVQVPSGMGAAILRRYRCCETCAAWRFRDAPWEATE